MKNTNKKFASFVAWLKTVPKVCIILMVLNLGALSCLFLAYGPYNGFRDWLITTSMSTMSHKYLARMLYSNTTIQRVLANNYIEEIDEATDLNAIMIGQETTTYTSVYDQQILEREEGTAYKIIDLSSFNVNGYLIAIYDPSKVTLGLSSSFGSIGQRVRTISENYNALIGINASGFEDEGEQGMGGSATGTVIKDGGIIWRGKDTGWGGGLIGFNQDNILVLTKESPEQAIANGIRDAVDFGPFLIVNGQAAFTKGNGGSGEHPRTAIAQRQDGIVLFLVIDGNGNKTGYRGGATYIEMIDILLKYKAYNAANLDGGASTILTVNHSVYNNPVAYNDTGERWHPNAWLVLE